MTVSNLPTYIAATIATIATVGMLVMASGTYVQPAAAVQPDEADEPAAADEADEADMVDGRRLPWLCEFRDGRWCVGPCGDCPGDVPAKAGALCCVANTAICVAWDGGACAGDLGWCMNYTTSTSPSGIEQAHCHDGGE